MRSSTLVTALLVISVLGCDAEPIGDPAPSPGLTPGKADDPRAACESLALPPIRVGSLTELPRTTTLIGPIDERSPHWLNSCAQSSLDADGVVRTVAWWFDADAGERLDLEPAFEVLGPLDDCEPPPLLAPAPDPVGLTWYATKPSEQRVQYMMPSAGRYLVTPRLQVQGGWSNERRLVHCRELPLDLRRLDDEGVPRAHTLLVEGLWGRGLDVADAQIARLWPGTTSIVATGRFNIDLFRGEQNVEIVTHEVDGTWSVVRHKACTQRYSFNHTQRSLVADFDQDGFQDILFDSDLFMGRPDRAFECVPSGVEHLSANAGSDHLDFAFDVDGDGDLDWLQAYSYPYGWGQGANRHLQQIVVARPAYFHEGRFYPGLPRKVVHEGVAAWYGTDRLALRDVDGDGTPEITVALYAERLGEDEPVTVNLAYRMIPYLGPAERAGSFQDYRAFGPELVPFPVPSDEPAWWGRQGRDRLVYADLDGDGVDDLVTVSRAHNTMIAVYWSYGEPTGELRAPWMRLVNEHDKVPIGRDDARVDVGDVDGDGCLDVVALGARGFGLLRGHNCTAP